MENTENMIEFISGARTATVTFTKNILIVLKNYMKIEKMISNIFMQTQMDRYVQNFR